MEGASTCINEYINTTSQFIYFRYIYNQIYVEFISLSHQKDSFTEHADISLSHSAEINIPRTYQQYGSTGECMPRGRHATNTGSTQNSFSRSNHFALQTIILVLPSFRSIAAFLLRFVSIHLQLVEWRQTRCHQANQSTAVSSPTRSC
jgi:hypothetical protein